MKIKVMKNIKTTLVTAIVVLLLFFAGCDKYHRDRYIGDWNFVTERHTFMEDDLGYYEKVKIDTIYYTGKITHGTLENELIIQYTENNEILVHIGTDGYLWLSYPRGDYGTCHQCSVGNFEKKDKISLSNLYHYVNQSEREIFSVNGKKKGDKK